MHQTPRSPVEPLEARRLFAAIGVNNSVLSVTGTATTVNTITVGLAPGGLSVVATVVYPTGQGKRAVSHTVTRTFDLTDVRSVRITGGNKADTITVDQTNGSFPLACKIYGGGGDDVITGGDEPDLVYGDAGNDHIDGGGGNDSLFGLAGDDTLIGGAGNDFLDGRRGHDVMLGGEGDDTLNDPFGPDTVLGGAGHNTFNVHLLTRDVNNDYNATRDTLHLIAVPSAPDNSTNTGILGSLFPLASFF